MKISSNWAELFTDSKGHCTSVLLITTNFGLSLDPTAANSLLTTEQLCYRNNIYDNTTKKSSLLF